MESLFHLNRIILKIRSYLFELYHRRGWKSFLCSSTPEKLRKFLLKKHLNSITSFPVTISIEVTNVCNAKCWFCSQPLSDRKKGYMSFDTYKNIMDQIKRHHKKVKTIALFMDGEPTLHGELVNFLKYAKKLKVENIYLSSNMEKFTPELTDSIFEANLGKTLKFIICSIDGANKQTYSKNRVGISFEKAIDNTEYFIKQRNLLKTVFPLVFTRLLLSDLTEGEIESFKEKWRRKADKVLCYPMHNWGGQIEDGRLKKYNYGDDFSSCYFPFGQFAIQYDGIVRLCCVDTNSSTILGDVNKQSIQEIWNNAIIKKIRSGHLNKKLNELPVICRKCSYPKKGMSTVPFYWE